MWVRFSARARARARRSTALHSTRSIEFPVHSPADAMAMVDPITYQKGGSVLRMLEQYLGADVFRDGIRRYLRRPRLREHRHRATCGPPSRRCRASPSARSWTPGSSRAATRSSRSRDGDALAAPFHLARRRGRLQHRRRRGACRCSRGRSTAARRVAQLLGDAPDRRSPRPPAVVNAGGVGRLPHELRHRRARRDRRAPRRAHRDRARGAARRHLGARARRGADRRRRARPRPGLGTEVEPSAWDVGRPRSSTSSTGHRRPTTDRAALDATRAPAARARSSTTLGWERAARRGRARPGRARDAGATARDDRARTRGPRRGRGALRRRRRRGRPRRRGRRGRRLHGPARRLRRDARGGSSEAKDPQTEERYRDGLAGDRRRGALPSRPSSTCFELFRTQDAPIVIVRLVTNPVGGRAVWEAVAARWDATLAQGPAADAVRARRRARLARHRRPRRSPSASSRSTGRTRSRPASSASSRRSSACSIGVAFAERARPDARPTRSGVTRRRRARGRACGAD